MIDLSLTVIQFIDLKRIKIVFTVHRKNELFATLFLCSRCPARDRQVMLQYLLEQHINFG